MPYELQVNTDELRQTATHARNMASAMGNAQIKLARIASSLPNLGNLRINVDSGLRSASFRGVSVAAAIGSVSSATRNVGNTANQFANAIIQASDLFVQLENELMGAEFEKIQPATVPTLVSAVCGTIHAVHARVQGPGYEVAEDGRSVTGWGKRYTGEWDFGDYGKGEVNAYLGKGKADWKVDLDFFNQKKKTEYNKETGKWETKDEFVIVGMELAGGISGSLIAIDGKHEVGDSTLGAEVSGKVDVVKGSLNGKAKLEISDEEISAIVKGEALVTAVEGEVKGTIKVLGIEITGKAEGYAGALGGKFEFGFKTDEETGKMKFVAEGGAAAVIGGSLGIEIGIPSFDDIAESAVGDAAKWLWDALTFWN